MVNALAVRLRDAVALAGRYPLLAGVDLDVRTGEIIVLKGANGAGKTSLLRVVAWPGPAGRRGRQRARPGPNRRRA